MYGAGEGAPQDLTIYYGAACTGDTIAMQIFSNGKGGCQDLIKAKTWYQRALDNGASNAEADLNIVNEFVTQQQKDLEKLGRVERQQSRSSSLIRTLNPTGHAYRPRNFQDQSNWLRLANGTTERCYVSKILSTCIFHDLLSR